MRRSVTCIALLLAVAATGVAATGYAEEAPIGNDWLIFTNEEKLGFDLEGFLAETAPHLVARSEVISHWTGYWGISPRVALALLELRTGLVSDRDPDPTLWSRPLGEWADAEGFSGQLKAALGDLSRRYYLERDKPGEFSMEPSAQRHGRSSRAAWDTLEAVLGREAWDLLDAYRAIFPEERGPRAAELAVEPLASGVPGWLRLPFPTGASWRFNGTHTPSGEDDSGEPFSSMDFSHEWPSWGHDTRGDWVSSAQDGRVVVYSSCSLEVVGDQGWSTHYYHLDNIAVRSGQFVSRGANLANYADQQDQALCDGGSSTGPHVHLTLRRRGELVDLDGVELSRYKVHAGRFSYDNDCDHFWLARGQQRWCAFNGLVNDGGVLFHDGFPEPDTAGWNRTVGSVAVVAPGLKGSAYALEAPVEGTAAGAFVQASLGKARKSVAASFLVLANRVALGGGEVVILTLGRKKDNVRVTLAKRSGRYRVVLYARTAAGDFREIGSARVPAARAVRIRVHWARDSDKSSPDGVARLFKGSRLVAEVINLDNHGLSVAKARLGLPAGTAAIEGGGSIVLDDLWISP